MTGALHLLKKQPPSASPIMPKKAGRAVSAGAGYALRGPGEALDPGTRRAMEHGFGHDFAEVRVHAGRDAALSARAMGAAAFASGTHIGFARGRYDPHSGEGRNLLAHELAHVVQQTGTGTTGPGRGGAPLEAEADAAADAVSSGRDVPPLSAAGPAVQRRVEFRRVGRGEASGFEKLPRLIERLNEISARLTFHVDADGVLGITEEASGTETDFDRQMRDLIRDGRVIPLRLTNRHGLMFPDPDTFPASIPVQVDDWRSGYVDIDDLLASDDLGLQSGLLHLLTERSATRQYSRRMGEEPRDAAGVLLPFPQAEFDRVHDQGVDAELRLMRDFFGDPGMSIRAGTPGDVLRQFNMSPRAGAARRDIVRVHMSRSGRGERRGVNALTVDVLLADGTVMSAGDYRARLQRERAAAQPLRNLGNPLLEPGP